MLIHTRRRALGLLLAAGLGLRLIPGASRAFAQDDAEPEAPDDDGNADDTEEPEPEEPEEPECYDSKKFGAWTAEASDESAGATLNEAPSADPDACDLSMEFQANTDFESRVFITGTEKTPLPEDFLVKPENRLIAKNAAGEAIVDVPLCGNCTDIYDDQVSIVLPLATAPLLRDEKTVELVIRLAGKDKDCRFTIDTTAMRTALDWAGKRRDELVQERDDAKCVSP